MRIENEPHDYRAYYELTPEQHTAGIAWLRETGGLNFESSEEDFTFIKIISATPQQITDFEAALNGA